MPKIALGRANGIAPALMYPIDRLSKKRPQYTFEASIIRDLNVLDKKEAWVHGVDVFDDGEKVGSISYGLLEGKENKDGEKPDAFGISSVHVKKERGERNTIVTADPAAAVRHALKVFGVAPLWETAENMYRECVSSINGCTYQWNYALREVVSYSHDEVFLMLAEHKILGKPLTAPESLKYDESKKGNYDLFLAGKQMMEGIEPPTPKGSASRPIPMGYAVRYMRDSSIRVVDLHTLATTMRAKTVKEDTSYHKRYRSFDDMPKHLQDRIAVLKVAATAEPVFNIGMRMSDDNEAGRYYVLHESSLKENPYES